VEGDCEARNFGEQKELGLGKKKLCWRSEWPCQGLDKVWASTLVASPPLSEFQFGDVKSDAGYY
jgi:hypothetical protein